MRCYHFCNYYYSQIQHGIQSAHAQMELFNKYNTENDDLNRWANLHKTMICLNGGDNRDLTEWLNILEQHAADGTNQYPFAGFYEEAGSVSHEPTLTNVAIILPEQVYNNKNIASVDVNDSKFFDMVLMDSIRTRNLA